MIVSFEPGGYTSSIRVHIVFNRSRANSSALSGRIPKTFSTLFADLNGKAGRHISTCVPATTNRSMIDKNLGLPAANFSVQSLNLFRRYSKIISKIMVEVFVTSIVVCEAREQALRLCLWIGEPMYSGQGNVGEVEISRPPR